MARAVLAAGLLAGGQIACAQDVAGSQGEGEGLEDIIVTARKVQERLQDAPHVFNVQADYNRNLSEDVTLGAHISASYIGRTPMANEVTWRQAHQTSDASLDLRFRNITPSAFGKNIFNEKYYTSYLPASATPLGALAPSLATPLGLLNRPAEYGVRLSGKF